MYKINSQDLLNINGGISIRFINHTTNTPDIAIFQSQPAFTSSNGLKIRNSDFQSFERLQFRFLRFL